MGSRKLKLVDADQSDRCGESTNGGTPCQHVTGGGPCWQHGGAESGDLPEAPGHLGEHGRECWYYHASDCADKGVLGQVDLTLIEKASEHYEKGRKAWDALQKHGFLIEGRSGKKKNPAASYHDNASVEYRQCVKELARLKAQATPEPDESDDPLADW